MSGLIDLLNKNKYDYLKIYNHPKTIKRISGKNREMNFYVAVKDRTEFFRATLRNIIIAANNSQTKVRIVIIEQNNESINDKFCEQFHVDYIFIPQEIAQCEEFHSTALMYNVGYLFAKQARYNFFHCCDILLPNNFFRRLNQNYFHHTSKPFNWLQPFHNKRVILINEDITKRYLDGELAYHCPDSLSGDEIKPENSGAPGGCICIKSETMDEIGGYCPEIYWGYTSEDADIWVRLETYFGKQKCTKTHFGNATYADNPIIDIYHFNHPRAQSLNYNFDKMQSYYEIYINATYEEQMEFIKYKSEEFKKQKQLINESKRKS